MRNVILITVILVLLLGLGWITLVNTNKNNAAPATASPTPATASPSDQAAASPTPSAQSSSLTDPADVASAHVILLHTSKGNVKLNLFPEETPHTVKNFVTLGKRGFYNGLTFHRVIKDFVIQGGDPNGDGTGGSSIYGKTFPDEITARKIVKGSLAMANSGPNTNGSQFFIVTQKDQPSLDGSYTNFGQVADDASQKTVETIAAVPTDSHDKPIEDVKITGFDIVEP